MSCLAHVLKNKTKQASIWKLALSSLCKKTPSKVLNIVKDMLNVFLNSYLERDRN